MLHQVAAISEAGVVMYESTVLNNDDTKNSLFDMTSKLCYSMHKCERGHVFSDFMLFTKRRHLTAWFELSSQELSKAATQSH